VGAALDLLDADGFDQMSLRRLASHLGMHAPGLYWYIESKQDLIDLMAKAILDRGLADLKRPAPETKWEDWLVELACTTRQALLAYRDVFWRGRDYEDVPPFKGIYSGRAKASLEVVVAITRLA